MVLWIFRAFVLSLITIGGFFYPPFKLSPGFGAGAALLAGALMMFLETRIRTVPFRVLWSAGWGLGAGLLAGWLLGALYRSVVHTPEMASFVRIFFLVIMPYIGLQI